MCKYKEQIGRWKREEEMKDTSADFLILQRDTVLMKWKIDVELYSGCKGINRRIRIIDVSILGRMWDVRVVWAKSSA